IMAVALSSSFAAAGAAKELDSATAMIRPRQGNRILFNADPLNSCSRSKHKTLRAVVLQRNDTPRATLLGTPECCGGSEAPAFDENALDRENSQQFAGRFVVDS